MKTPTVNITQRNIEEACRRDSRHCMIADAIQFKFPRARYISVDLQAVKFSNDGLRYTFLTPPEAQSALLAFDQGRKVMPFKMLLKDGISRPSYSGGATNKTNPNRDRLHRKYKHRSFKREFGLKTFVR